MADNAPLQPVEDPANWIGKDLDQDQHWLIELNQQELDALVHMTIEPIRALDNDPDRLMGLPHSVFDPGVASNVIRRVFDSLKAGPGLALIRGLPVDQLTSLEMATIYWGIGLHLGSAIPNNPDGDMLGHVTDLGKSQADPNSRGYQTREAMDYHCDQSDLVGLLCVRAAKSGGVSHVASSVAMYNTLLHRYPELANALATPFYWTKHGEHPASEQPFYTSPVFNFLDGQLSTSFGPKHIFKGHDLPDTPELPDVARRAIEVAEEIAHAQRLEMTLEPGDMQFVNNYVVLHTRTAYEDHSEAGQKRLLWRLWLMNDSLRPRTDYSRQWQRGVRRSHSVTQIRL